MLGKATNRLIYVTEEGEFAASRRISDSEKEIYFGLEKDAAAKGMKRSAMR